MTRKAATVTLTLLVLAAWCAFLIFWLPGLSPDRKAALWMVLGSFGVVAAIVGVDLTIEKHNLIKAQVALLLMRFARAA